MIGTNDIIALTQCTKEQGDAVIDLIGQETASLRVRAAQLEDEKAKLVTQKLNREFVIGEWREAAEKIKHVLAEYSAVSYPFREG